MLGRLQSLPRVSLGRALTLPRGTVGLRRKPQTPPLGTFSTAQDSRLRRVCLVEPESQLSWLRHLPRRRVRAAARAPSTES